MHRPDRRVVLGLHRTRHARSILEAALERGVRDLDTAFNYANFSSHERLAQLAPDLLGEFYLSTKVGFFPAPGGPAEHSLEPARLRDALRLTADTLGRVPDLVFLHNPERAVREAGLDRGRDLFLAAAATMDEEARAGTTRAWGVSTWDARPLALALSAVGATGAAPRPARLMHRSGVLVSPGVLAATDEIAGLLRVDAADRWGMSPFGGDTRPPFWEKLRLTPLLGSPPPAGVDTFQAAFRLAYELPPVTRVAVSANDPGHLDRLLDAVRLPVDPARVDQYRDLLGRPPRPAHAT
ncbi:aldo/keto reductase [Frankia sp. CNm7]|uniref:Aldo/keto reductase n=1 Tax=Frankia nepalensis TaxID=1836974 RepID=A0A937RNW3_9ACTN|nr:aldo/keto reductase [Frankia nepalensis]MBL7495966.1 aldo/keto reductase [Frankia nepalensis]MBL7515706.1 aldo/keto reductase [Frankia nepalensis]MBL7517602.1 aldo/keto reductase [Frankia nepalensis]MBL7633487.1 aldo/keto reductase [Frankia nepalensis]